MVSKSFTKLFLRPCLNKFRNTGIPRTFQEVLVVLEEVSGELGSSCGACKFLEYFRVLWDMKEVQGFLYKVPGPLCLVFKKVCRF